ncbi:MAG: hypothetical protein FWD71_19675 [Oscillospiraceae bacterium]|nr:hypothetical protein [Oscillospiraceae bacterium]
MATEKRIQLPKTFLTHVETLLNELSHDGLNNLSWKVHDEFNSIKREIEDYYERQARRQVFTQYKTAEPKTPEREEARQKYLDMAGIMPDWQSSREIPEDEGYPE